VLSTGHFATPFSLAGCCLLTKFREGDVASCFKCSCNVLLNEVSTWCTLSLHTV
jgi:hypothetical protein